MSFIKLFKDTFSYGVIPKISTIINIIILPIITPYLTPKDYGIWGIITSYSNMFLAIAPLGLHIHLTNSFFEYKKWNLVWGRILYYFLLSGLFFATLNIVVLLFVLKELVFWQRLLVAILGSFNILFFSNGVIAASFYPLVGKPNPLVFRNLVSSLSSILFSFTLIYYLKLGFWGFATGAALSSLLSFLLFIKPIYIKEHIKPIVDKKLSHVKEWMSVSVYVIPHAIGFVLLTSSSRIIMDWYNIPINEIGIFSNGYMVGDYIVVVATSLSIAIGPTMQKMYRKSDYSNYRKLFYMCLMITLCIVSIFALWMPEIYGLLINNPQFNDSIFIARIICFANIVYPFYSFQATISFIEKNTKQLLWLIFFPGIVNIALCTIFIPIWGYKVACFTTLTAFWSQLLVPFISNYHKEKVLLWINKRIRLLYLLVFLLFVVTFFNYMSMTYVYMKIILTVSVLTVAFFIYYHKFRSIQLYYGKSLENNK